MALHLIIKNKDTIHHTHDTLAATTPAVENELHVYLAAASESENPFFSVDPGIALWLWVVFILTLLVLYRFAWKPILKALDERENKISAAIENAKKIEIGLREAKETSKKIFQDAQEKSNQMLEAARKHSDEVRESAAGKARSEAEDIVVKARKSIENEKATAITQLRSEATRLSISIASKLIEENLDDEKNRKLSEKFLQENQ